MKSLQNISLLFVAVLISALPATAQTHENLEDYGAREEGVHTVVIEWEVRDVSLLSSYMLERSVTGSSSDFQNFNMSSCLQNGNRFQCTDKDLFKGSSDQAAATGSVSYRLRVTHPDGTPHIYFQTTVEYTTNAVRRTWGSIKSMFQ